MKYESPYYSFFWRWHFYAGLFIFPILFVMAITGGMYLLQPQIEDALYSDSIYLSEPYQGAIDHDALIANATKQYSSDKIHSYQPPQNSEHSAQLVLTTKNGDKLTVFMHPSNNQVIDVVNEDWRLMNLARAIHGGLMLGTIGELIVELVACWTIILVISGLYLWWPRGNKQRGVFIPKLHLKGRKFWREIHSVFGAWAGLWILAIILTGLPWSVLWGDLYSKTGHAIGEGFPKAIFSERPHSTSDVTAPEVSMNKLMKTLSALNMQHDYKIDYPWFPNGVYAVMPTRHGGASQDVAYVFLDKRSGEVIKDLRWDDLGLFGKASSLGVQFHEGRLFGSLNQYINLFAVITLIGLSITGPIMWWKRKPKGELGAPITKRKKPLTPIFIGFIVFLALFLPLFGLSLIFIWLGEACYRKWSSQ